MPRRAASCAIVGQLLFGDQRAGRIRRRVDDDAARPRRDRRQERLGVQREAVLRVRADDHRRRVGELDLLDQRRPARHVRDHFVAAVEDRQDGVEQRLLAARRDDHFGRRVLDAVVGLVALDDGALEIVGAGVGRVLGEVRVDGAMGGRLDVRRRRKVGLPGAEIDHVDALRLQAHGVGGHLHRRRDGDPGGACGECHVRPSGFRARASCPAAGSRQPTGPAR